MKKAKSLVIVIAIILVILIVIIIAGYHILRKLYPKDYSEYVEKYSKMYEIDDELIFAMIKEESNFKKDVSSNKNAIGLMQLVQETADEVGREIGIEEVDLKDPEVNIQIGTKYISDLINRYDGNTLLGIIAYNAGIGNVDNWIEKGIINEDGSNLEKIPFKETNMYLRKVLRTYELYQRLY